MEGFFCHFHKVFSWNCKLKLFQLSSYSLYRTAKNFQADYSVLEKKPFLWTFFQSRYDTCPIYFASDSSVYNFTIDLKVFARRKSTNELSTTLINGCIITFRMAKTRKKIWKTWFFDLEANFFHIFLEQRIWFSRPIYATLSDLSNFPLSS